MSGNSSRRVGVGERRASSGHMGGLDLTAAQAGWAVTIRFGLLLTLRRTAQVGALVLVERFAASRGWL